MDRVKPTLSVFFVGLCVTFFFFASPKSWADSEHGPQRKSTQNTQPTSTPAVAQKPSPTPTTAPNPTQPPPSATPAPATSTNTGSSNPPTNSSGSSSNQPPTTHSEDISRDGQQPTTNTTTIPNDSTLVQNIAPIAPPSPSASPQSYTNPAPAPAKHTASPLIQTLSKSKPLQTVAAPLSAIGNAIPKEFYHYTRLSPTASRLLSIVSGLFFLLGIFLLQPIWLAHLLQALRTKTSKLFAYPEATYLSG